MSFAAFTSQELSQLADRLAAAAAHEAEVAARQAAAALQPTIDDLRSQHARLEQESAALRDKHAQTESAYAKAQNELERIQAAHAKAQNELDLIQAAHAKAQDEHAKLKTAHAKAQEEHAQLKAAHTRVQEEQVKLKAAHARAQEEQAQLKAALARAQEEQAQINASHAAAHARAEEEHARTFAAHNAIAEECDRLKAEVARLETERAEIEAEHAQLSSASRELTDERESVELALQQTRNLLDAARADAMRLSDELEQNVAEKTALAAQLEIAQSSQRGPLLRNVHAAFERVVQSAAVEEVLEAVADGLSGDFSRVAVFTIRENRLEPAYRYGFEEHSGIGKVVIPLTVDSLFTQALNADAVCASGADAIADGAPFGGSPEFVVAAPIKIRDEVMAVIYADDSGMSAPADPEDRMRLAELLKHCAVLRLERLTIELKTLAELRSYAKMLLDEVEYVYAADLNAGKSDAERQARMQENLRCARQIYQQRVASEGPAAAMVLEQQIKASAEAKSESPYGRDLAFVATLADSNDNTAAAQAS
jgi:hypothetical protein